MFGGAVPLNFIVSPGLNCKAVGVMIITLPDSTAQDVEISSLPSEITAVYLPNGASIGTIIGSIFQSPLESTFAVLVLIIFSSIFLIDAVMPPLGWAVPETSIKSPLCNTSGIPLIVSFIFSVAGFLVSASIILRLIFFSFPALSLTEKSTLSAF